ncbi:MAG: hypothetical protein P0S96_01235 [Simkaniaceae bacterium]|nr:hypothetical protein [Candidatus Sacchlamyda saccharinae]
MQVQAQALFNFVLDHPAEIATGMVAAAAVSAIVLKSSVFNGSRTFAAVNGFFAGTVITYVIMQPELGVKLCGAVATAAFASLAVRPKNTQPYNFSVVSLRGC